MVGAQGDVIDGRFELVGRLGSGGMGTVWRARDLALQREVALKEVRTPDGDVEDTRLTRGRVTREAQALARLSHPNVVSIHHLVEDDPHPWLVMELVPGESLHERLVRDGALPPTRSRASGSTCAARCRRRTTPACTTATSSPATCCCGPTAPRCSPTSASPRSSTRPG
ncbi:hypothetical protein GCM10025872_17710 [Barrientosiimonas endolithica]|uniref:non-specific serine/threonine protein kinase n=1 Tax=Barrientosiimonas endolithica TaxID=1535208 RepID=A0ABM8HB00_9MICO|nr:hypothetical protein GCM10025872_17710 [Barrientosiimonas endolithica]